MKSLENKMRGIIYINEDGKEEVLIDGYRQLTEELPINQDTSFPTASAGKVFVAVAILHLIEEGKLTLESTIGEVLSIELHDIDPEVTVFQLLTHTSGVPDYCDEEVILDYADLWIDYPNYKIRTQSDLLPLFITEPMKFPKGERFEYNNSGFVFLGLIIEEITGAPFDHYLSEIIFDPLNMDHTGYYEMDRLPNNCAYAYIYDKNKEEYHTGIYSVDVKGTGAGGAYTSVNDIHKFWEGLLSNKLLSEEMTTNMLFPHITEERFNYGLGIWIDTLLNPYFVGSDPGVSFHTVYLKESKTEMTLISNFEDNVWATYRELLDRQKK